MIFNELYDILHSNNGLYAIYLNRCDNGYSKQYWENVLGMEMHKLPDWANPSQFQKFLDSEQMYVRTNNKSKLFYTVSFGDASFSDLGIEMRVSMTCDCVLTFDGEFLRNVKNRYMKNGQTIRIDNPISYAWRNYFQE